MDRLSLVVVRVLRPSEQVTKSEQYLVKHTDEERADEKAIEYLKTFLSRTRDRCAHRASERLCGAIGA